MEIFEEYSPYSDKDAQLTLAGNMKDWSWFKIYVFTKKKDWFGKGTWDIEWSFVKTWMQ